MMKIPEQAEKKFDGVFFNIYHWEQELFDGSKKTFEALKRKPAVMVIAVTEDQKILYIDEKQPPNKEFLGIVSGSIDEGEEPLHAAKRELEEETGYESDDWELWKIYDSFHHMEWNLYAFIAKNCKKTKEQRLDPGEKIIVKKASFEEFIKLMKNRKFRNDILALDILRMNEDELEVFRKKLFSLCNV